VTTHRVTDGDPATLGVSLTEHGIRIAVASAQASRIDFCLFDDEGNTELARLPLPGRNGPVFHAEITNILPGSRYGLRAHGPWDHRRGLLFNPAKLLIDPYAISLDRQPHYHPAQRADRPDGSRDPADSAPYVPKAIVTAAPPVALSLPLHPLASSVIYELHVRGFTRLHPAIPEAIRGTFAGLAHPAAIAHLKEIGVTSVELMPAMAAIEERHLAELGLANYWGYNPIAFLAPDPRLTPGGWAEIRAATDALRQAGIETILDVVYNHTGEGDIEGPCLSLRGLDHSSYFRLQADGNQINDSGCGNTLALDQPAMLRLAMDSLRAWALWGGIQGFRFDLAVTLARRDSGFDPRAPLLQAITQDPVLSRLKLIAEPWDVGPGGWQTGNFPPPFAEWNDRFRDDVRRFWRGDEAMLGGLATRLAGSDDLFRSRPSADSINFVTAHDGFTLADLVSYRSKHNEANGEQNRDGTDDNKSWNNGCEGATADPAIIAARIRDQAALLATLLLSRGTPMLSQGAELGFSQSGNNNAYAQDNEATWLDWAQADHDLIAITRKLTLWRASHPWAWQGAGLSDDGGPYPETVWCGAHGAVLAEADWRNPHADLLVMVRTQPDGGERIALIFHRGPTPQPVMLPAARPGRNWTLAFCSDECIQPASPPAISGAAFLCPARSVAVLQEEKATGRDQTANDASVARLATAAGIATEWWDVSGDRHVVPTSTFRALLDGLGFPAHTQSDAEESLNRLAHQFCRSLPVAFAVRENRLAQLPIPLGKGADPAPITLQLTDEQGATSELHITADHGSVGLESAPDGRRHRVWRVELPPLPIGRYRLDFEGTGCALTVAPERCHQPLDHRVIGLTAQLYSLRRHGDQGIGDLTTLAEAAAFTARNGAALLGINPLHALFPHQRDRASPYHPSDRRFIDPIMIDLAATDPGLDGAPVRALLESHRQHIAALSAAATIDHRAVWQIKQEVLRAADRGTPEFAGFRAGASPSLQDFALFSTISDAHSGISWQNWPVELRDRDPAALAAFASVHHEAIDFHLYLQFLAERGLARAAAQGLSIGLLRDLAVGAAGDGAECWSHSKLYVQAASIGAPPDPLAPQGQIWALPPPNPHVWRQQGFASFIELVQTNMRHAGALRIDHILGLRRLFWVPNGATPAEGAYVQAPMENLFAELALESHRAKCMVIGEDLGTVPPGLREAMEDHAILRNRVLLLDYDHNGFPSAAGYPVLCATSVASHDMPTLAGWKLGADIAERAELGMFDAATAAQERTSRAAAITALDQIAGGTDPEAVHAHIARTPSLIATAQIEDLAHETTSVNLPGTDRERPNWRRKITPPIDEIETEIIKDMEAQRSSV